MFVLVPIAVAGGTANGSLNVCASAVVLTRAPDEIRGRVGAAMGAVFSAGSVPSLVVGGILGQALAPRQVFSVAGVLALGTAAVCVPRAIRASRAVSAPATLARGGERRRRSTRTSLTSTRS